KHPDAHVDDADGRWNGSSRAFVSGPLWTRVVRDRAWRAWALRNRLLGGGDFRRSDRIGGSGRASRPVRGELTREGALEADPGGASPVEVADASYSSWTFGLGSSTLHGLQ